MRSKGSKTQQLCWKLQIINQNAVIFEKDYTTLKEISNEVGMTYNQVVELSSGRKKQPKGRFDTTYKFIKLNKQKCKTEHFKITDSESEKEYEPKQDTIDVVKTLYKD